MLHYTPAAVHSCCGHSVMVSVLQQHGVTNMSLSVCFLPREVGGSYPSTEPELELCHSYASGANVGSYQVCNLTAFSRSLNRQRGNHTFPEPQIEYYCWVEISSEKLQEVF